MLKMLIVAWVLVLLVLFVVAVVGTIGTILLPRDRRQSALTKTNRHYLRSGR
jgi:hypothetical protein